MASCNIKSNLKTAVLGISYYACLKYRNLRVVMMEEELEADIHDDTRPSTSGKFVYVAF